MLVDQLINFAWYLSGIVPRDLGDVSGSQINDGLFWLNQLISEKSTTVDFIPYYTHTTINSVINQEIYFLEGYADIEVVTFNLSDVRFAMRKQTRAFYFGLPRVNDITTIPIYFYVERVNGGSNLYVYPFPNQTYPLNITGRVTLPQVVLGEELNTVVDQFYQSYLMYQLAIRLCDWYKIEPPDSTKAQMKAFDRQLVDLNAKDLSVVKKSSLTKIGGFNWGQVNIGRGYTTP